MLNPISEASYKSEKAKPTSEPFAEFVIEKEGLVWPKADTICFEAIKRDLPFLEKALSYCKTRNLVIQAGGNAGMYPVFLAKHFKKVLTFEPQDINFYCLEQNIKKARNVKATNAALGNSNQPVSLKGWAPNCGAYEINGFGAIEQIRIDDLKLDEVDFIQLDVQGYEDKVLKGAEQTLKRCAPVLMLEEGWGPNVANYLHELRYTPVESSTNKGRVRDTIYIKA